MKRQVVIGASPMASSAALQVSGELDFPLLDLRVDFNATAVSELQHLYEQSQQNWVQHWRDQFAALPDGRPRPAEDEGGLNAGVAQPPSLNEGSAKK